MTKRKNIATTGERLEDLIKGNNTNQKAVSKATGVSQPSLSEIINGNREMQTDTLKKLCRYFNVSADYLLGLSDTPSCDPNIQMIHNHTGLSKEVIEKIHGFKNYQPNCFSNASASYTDVINWILLSNEFEKIIDYFVYLDSYKEQLIILKKIYETNKRLETSKQGERNAIKGQMKDLIIEAVNIIDYPIELLDNYRLCKFEISESLRSLVMSRAEDDSFLTKRFLEELITIMVSYAEENEEDTTDAEEE